MAAPDSGAGGWLPISHLADGHRGDVIAWSLTVNPEKDHNTGHVMIVADDPAEDGDDVLSVRVYDSSDVIHFDDTRGRLTGHGRRNGHRPNSRQRRRADRVSVWAGTDMFHTHPISIGRIEPLSP